MATPSGRSNSVPALNTGPSRTLLQQLLEEINGASPTRSALNESTPQSPASTRFWSNFQNHSPSIWVGGSSIAQDARNKLRAADEARRRKVAANVIDSAPDLQTPMLHLDTSGLREQEVTPHEHETGSSALHRTPDPVRYPHDYMQYMMKGTPLSTTVGLSPAALGHDNTPLHLQAPSFGHDIPRPLSPLMFSDVDFDDSSLSPQTETTASPTEAPTSAATVYTAEEPQTPTGVETRKRTYFSDDSTPEASPPKRRTVTLPDIRSDAYPKMAVNAPHSFISVGGDNRCVLRDETFTERVPRPSMLADLSTTDALPELSSFRPTVADPQGQPALKPPSQKLARAHTSPVEPASPAMPDTPAWMRPMHLIDIGGKSIYMNTHDDGPICHALCLYCFRAQGSFRKVDRHGYETCGRTEVLDSHYWEPDVWPEESSDESTFSEC